MHITDMEFINLLRSKQNVTGNEQQSILLDVTTEQWKKAKKVAQQINNQPDREDIILKLKNCIMAGQYRPSSDEIVEAMVRRTIVDQIS